MVNYGPLAAEIVSLVCGTPANFNGFRVLAALLHGTPVVGVSKLCGVEQRAPPVFGRATITLGIGPHSSYIYFYLRNVIFWCTSKHYYVWIIMAALWNKAGHYIFALWFLYSIYLSFFPRLISAAGDWMSTILAHIVWS